MNSCIYECNVMHHRLEPKEHQFSYRIFMFALDLDEVEVLSKRLPFFSLNRWNLYTFRDRDHLTLPGSEMKSVKENIVAYLGGNGIHFPADGRIKLVTLPRVLGYIFNPVSFYYCFDRQHVLRTVLAEVNNTFGGSHNYWLAPEDATRVLDGPLSAAPQLFTSSATKSLYVSPFMEGTLDYEFAFTSPLGQLAAHMTVRQPGAVRTTFTATLSLERRPWTAAAVRHVLLRYPLMTAKVTAGIHWEALKLWRKGVPVVPREHPAGLMSADARPRWTGRAIEP